MFFCVQKPISTGLELDKVKLRRCQYGKCGCVWIIRIDKVSSFLSMFVEYVLHAFKYKSYMNYYRYHNAICVNFHVFQTNLCLPQTQMGWTCPLVRCCRPWFSWTCHPSTCNQHRTPKKKKNRGFWYKQNHLPNFHFSDFSLLFRCVLVICNDVYIFAHIFFCIYFNIYIYLFRYTM